MDQAFQDEFRADIKKSYLKKAWECFLNYDFQGVRYGKIEKEFDEKESTIKTLEGQIAAIQALPDFHTVENKNKVKIFREEIRRHQKEIEAMKPVAEKMYKELVDWQQKGMQLLETAEHAEKFKLKTNEEIAADLKAKSDALKDPAEPVKA